MDYPSPTRVVKLTEIPTLRCSPSTPPRVIDVRPRPILSAAPVPPIARQRVRQRPQPEPQLQSQPQQIPHFRPKPKPQPQPRQYLHPPPLVKTQIQPPLQPRSPPLQPRSSPQLPLEPRSLPQPEPQLYAHQPPLPPVSQLPPQPHLSPQSRPSPQQQLYPQPQPQQHLVQQPQTSTRKSYQEEQPLSIPLVEDIHRDLKNLTKLLMYHMQLESPKKSNPPPSSRVAAPVQEEDSLADISMASRDYMKKHNIL